MNWRAQSRRLLLYSIVAVGGFLMAYLLVAFVIFPADIVPDEGKIPSVVGLSFDEAAQRLATAGFRSKQGESRFNDNVPKSTVLAPSPPAGGRELRGTEVVLDVSAGQRLAEVPGVIGLAQQAAQVQIENAGLEVGTVTERESMSPRGEVLEVNPPAGERVPPSTQIQLVVSGGPATITVPDLIGRDLPQARAMIEQLGLRTGDVTVDSTSVSLANTVVAQSPAAGAAIPAGSRINLRVSPGTP